MKNPERALRIFARELAHAGMDAGDVVLFGSTVMHLHGLREKVGDVDAFVTRAAWGRLLPRTPWRVLTPRAGDPPLLELAISPPVHVFYDWTERDAAWLNVAEVWASAERVGGWPCASLEVVLRHKRKSFDAYPASPRHAKHERDAQLIESYLGVRA